MSSQAGAEADATAEVRAHQEAQEQAAAGLWLVAGTAAGRQSANYSVTAGQDQPTEPGCSASTDVHDVSQHQLYRECARRGCCPAEWRFRLRYSLRFRFRVARIGPAVTSLICHRRHHRSRLFDCTRCRQAPIPRSFRNRQYLWQFFQNGGGSEALRERFSQRLCSC